MPNSSRLTASAAGRAFVFVAALALCGCASSPPPVAFEGLQTAKQLQPIHDARTPFLYKNSAADLSRYPALLIDPVTIYEGPDNQFGSISGDDRRSIANYLQERLRMVLGQSVRIADVAEPGAARLHLTLTGLETSTPFFSAVSHLDPGGLLINGVLQASGRRGTFTGSVTYAVELTDAISGEVLLAYVTKQAPNALDISSSFRTLAAARTGVDKGVTQLRDKLTQAGMATTGVGVRPSATSSTQEK